MTKTNEFGIVGAVPKEPRAHGKAAQRKYQQAEDRIAELKRKFLEDLAAE